MRHRDAKYSEAFDEVFRAGSTRVIRTPVRAPRANAHAERWVRTVRAECLDHMLLLSRRHMDRVLAEYVASTTRPDLIDRWVWLLPEPRPAAARESVPTVECTARFGGLIREYEAVAAWEFSF